jgi:hypothetical protein
VDAQLDPLEPRATAEAGAPPPRESSAACRDQPQNELAVISCDAQRILVKFPIRVYPNERAAGDSTPAVLQAVADLLRQHDEILLLRIDVYSALRPPADPAARRRELLETQARADAVLKVLWRRHGISAERLEAVGHGATRRPTGESSARWTVVFVIAQRARR